MTGFYHHVCSMNALHRYKNDREIVAMTNLVSAYQRKDISEFERILRGNVWLVVDWIWQWIDIFLLVNRQSIMGDSFIRDYIDDVLRNIRTLVLVKLIKPYTRVELSFIAKVKADMKQYNTHMLILDCLASQHYCGRSGRVSCWSHFGQ